MIRADCRVTIYNDLIHLDAPPSGLEVGDEIPVVRGGGPRDGDRMGTAHIVGFNADGTPEIDVHLGPTE